LKPPMISPEQQQESSGSHPDGSNGAARSTVLTLDLEKYLGQLSDWDITETQKIEFISTFWNLLVSFGELGFGIHSVQRAENAAQKTRGKPPKPQEKPTVLADDMLYSAYQKFTIKLDEPDAENAAGKGEIQA